MSRGIGIGVVVLSLVLASPSARADAVAFATPDEHGAVGPGERVAYVLEGSCDDVDVRAVVVLDDRDLTGAASTGCRGTVDVPAHDAEHEITGVVLRAERDDEVLTERTLATKRIEAERATVIAGDVVVSDVTDDPFGGGRALDVAAPSAIVSLGTVDLRAISSVAVRAVAPQGACLPNYEAGFSTYCRAGTVVLTAGSPNGPLLAVADILAGDAARPWRRTVSEPLRHHPSGPVEVVATVNAPVGARINFVELNGSGVAEPHVHPADPPGTVTLLDDSPETFASWRMAGTGSFEREPDGSIRSVSGYGLLWHPQPLADGAVRLEFRVDSPDANSGVFVRIADPAGNALSGNDTGYEAQIQDYGQAYFGSSDTSQTGSIYSFAAADRVNTRTVGEWNTLEVRTVGHRYTVTLNGRTVTDFTGDRRTAGFVGVQNHDPSGTVWFRAIRFVPVEALT